MKFILIGFMSMFLLIASCAKDVGNHSCYDNELAKKNKDIFCTQDCPGFEGCDGKMYCNSCEAARQGIGPK